MTIVPYYDHYHDDVIKIIENFYHEALCDFSAPIDPSIIEQTIEKYKDGAFLMVDQDKCVGLIAGQVTTSPLNSEPVFQELIWYVNQDHRLKGVIFLREVEAMLKERGIKQLVMALMVNSKADKLAALYERMGFRPMEQHWVKNL